MLSTSSGRNVQTVERTFNIINVLQMYGRLTLQELSEKLEMAKSTLHNYLSTLESLGYVINQNGSYRLGMRFLNHGIAARNALQTQTPVADELNALSKKVSETVWWILEELGRAIFIMASNTEENTDVYAQVGKRSYLHTHAPGKAMLAHHSNEYVDLVINHNGLPRYTSKTIVDKNKLLDELSQIRERGYAISEGETVHGVNSIGVAFEDTHNFVHSLGIFRYIHDENTAFSQHQLIPELQDSVNRISEIIEEDD